MQPFQINSRSQWSEEIPLSLQMMRARVYLRVKWCVHSIFISIVGFLMALFNVICGIFGGLKWFQLKFKYFAMTAGRCACSNTFQRCERICTVFFSLLISIIRNVSSIHHEIRTWVLTFILAHSVNDSKTASKMKAMKSYNHWMEWNGM